MEWYEYCNAYLDQEGDNLGIPSAFKRWFKAIEFEQFWWWEDSFFSGVNQADYSDDELKRLLRLHKEDEYLKGKSFDEIVALDNDEFMVEDNELFSRFQQLRSLPTVQLDPLFDDEEGMV